MLSRADDVLKLAVVILVLALALTAALGALWWFMAELIILIATVFVSMFLCIAFIAYCWAKFRYYPLKRELPQDVKYLIKPDDNGNSPTFLGFIDDNRRQLPASDDNVIDGAWSIKAPMD